MKRLSTSYFLVFITITNFHYNYAEFFKKEILISIEEVHGDGGVKLKLHPLTTMSQVEKERLCSAAKERTLLSDNPSESKLYTRLFQLKPESGKESIFEQLTSSAVDETTSSISESYIDHLNRYTRLHKSKSENQNEGSGVETPSSRSIEERASFLHNNYTETQMGAHLSSMLQNSSKTEPHLFSDNKEIPADNLYANIMKLEDEKEGVATDDRSSAATGQTKNISLSNDYTQMDIDTDLSNLNLIPKDEIEDFLDDYEEEVALVCPTVPVVRLSLGDSTDKIKIMFSYVFSVEAIHSITPVPDHEVDDKLKRNHLLTFEQEQLHALCNFTRKCVPIDNVVFKRHEISKPQIFEITYLPDFEKPNLREVVITCPLNPYTAYLRYQPPNEMKIMVTDSALLELLHKYGLNAKDITESVKKPVDENTSGVLTK